MAVQRYLSVIGSRDRYRGDGSRRPLFLISSGVSWDDGGRAGTEYHLAKHLAEHAEVLWVDPPASCVSRARPNAPRLDARRRLFRPELTALSNTMRRLRTIGAPGLSRPGVRLITWPAVRAQTQWALGRMGRQPDVVIACHWNDVLVNWGQGVVKVLFGTDDWLAGADLMGEDPDRLLAAERRSIEQADLVLAVTPQLAERWRGLGADPVVFPNGCDPDAYLRVPFVEPAPVPEGFPTPVAGAVGMLTDRIDINLLTAVADSGAGLLLVGWRDPKWSTSKFDALVGRPNVQHVGALPFEELPRWFARIDVGLTPYADSAFNRASFPLKTLDYLAAGLPVVSTDLPASRLLNQETNQVRLATNSQTFVEAVAQAASSRRQPEAIRERQAVARRHSWSARAQELSRLVGVPHYHRTSGHPRDVAERDVVDGAV